MQQNQIKTARGRARIAALVGLAVALGTWVLAAGPSVSAQPAPAIASSLVATQEMFGLTTGARWVVRNEHATNAQHSHAGGFVFVMNGSSTLKMDGEEVPLQQAQAIWVPESTPHTHTGDGNTKLWTFSLELVLDPQSGQPSFVSKELVGYAEGPHLARLVSDEYPVGAGTPPHRHYGPEVVFVREGTYELNYAGSPQTYNPNQGYMVEPLTPHRLRNAGQATARLFGLSLVPIDRAPSEALPADALR
jgi:quercetin dioxygenase-like cupin family protein